MINHIHSGSEDFGTVRWDCPPSPKMQINGGTEEADQVHPLMYPGQLFGVQPESGFLRLFEKAINNLRLPRQSKERIENFMISVAQLEMAETGLGENIFKEVTKIYKEAHPREFNQL